jgi:hypothetical protein
LASGTSLDIIPNIIRCHERKHKLCCEEGRGTKVMLITDMYIIITGGLLRFSPFLYKMPLLLSLIHFTVTSVQTSQFQVLRV